MRRRFRIVLISSKTSYFKDSYCYKCLSPHQRDERKRRKSAFRNKRSPLKRAPTLCCEIVMPSTENDYCLDDVELLLEVWVFIVFVILRLEISLAHIFNRKSVYRNSFLLRDCFGGKRMLSSTLCGQIKSFKVGEQDRLNLGIQIKIHFQTLQIPLA